MLISSQKPMSLSVAYKREKPQTIFYQKHLPFVAKHLNACLACVILMCNYQVVFACIEAILRKCVQAKVKHQLQPWLFILMLYPVRAFTLLQSMIIWQPVTVNKWADYIISQAFQQVSLWPILIITNVKKHMVLMLPMVLIMNLVLIIFAITWCPMYPKWYSVH